METWPAARSTHTHLGPLEYRDVGDGPVVVFLHLVLAAGDHWDRVVPLLADRYRCIVPDLPMGAHRLPADEGADVSPRGIARAVAELLDHLDVDDVTVVGSDTGGAITQLIGAFHGDRVGRLVLIDCDMYDEFPPTMFKSLALAAAIPGGINSLAQILRIRALWRLPMTFGRLAHDIDGDKIERWAAALRADPAITRDARAVIRAMSTDDTNAAAAALVTAELPVLLAWSEDGKAFSRSNAERMAAEVPHAELVLVPDSKAFVCWDQPARLAELIDGFVGAEPDG